MDDKKMSQSIEAMLFVFGEPLAIQKISKLLSCDENSIRRVIEKLQKDYLEQERGFAIIQKDNAVQMTTCPECAPYVQMLAKGELSQRLSQSTLETLSIVAYRGPVSRSDIESIRGVNSSFALRNLLLRGLVDRFESETDSRVYLYRPAFELLRTLGIQSLNDLPDYDSLSQDPRVNLVANESPNQD